MAAGGPAAAALGGPPFAGLGPGLVTCLPHVGAADAHWWLYVVDWADAAAPPTLLCLDSWPPDGPPREPGPALAALLDRALPPDTAYACVDVPRQLQTGDERNGCGLHVLQNLEALARWHAAAAGRPPGPGWWRVGGLTRRLADWPRAMNGHRARLRDALYALRSLPVRRVAGAVRGAGRGPLRPFLAPAAGAGADD